MTATADEQLAGPSTLLELLRAHEVSARELVDLCLRRIESLDPRLNAFRATIAEQALAAADALTDLELPLAGLPIAVKDDTPVAGQPTTRGSRSAAPPAAADAEIVRRLRAAGAIPIGITNVPELTIFPWTASEANGITRNPWNPTRTPGGSSGGSAAAVAAGMVPAATGSDGGGSIRLPAACCGLVGMKPSRGRVSTHPARELWLGLTVYGPLARSVRDSALLLDAMQGTADGDAASLPPPKRSFVEAAASPPGRLRVAISGKIPPGVVAHLGTGQHAAWKGTALLLQRLGHELVERDPDYSLGASLLFTRTWMRGIYEESRRLGEPSKLERSSRQLAAAGRVVVPARRREQLRAERTRVSARIMALFSEVDVLLTPALTTSAIAAEGAYGRSAPIALQRAASFVAYLPAFNITGQPAVTVPAGFGPDGLPVSVQLVGRVGAEDVLYALAAQVEAARPWTQHRPAIA